MTLQQTHPVVVNEADLKLTPAASESRRRILVSQTRQGLRRIESKKTLAFVVKETYAATDTPTTSIPVSRRTGGSLIKLFSFDRDSEPAIQAYTQPIGKSIRLQTLDDSQEIIDFIPKREHTSTKPNDTPKSEIFEVSNSPTSLKRTELETPRFSNLAGSRRHIFNRPLKIKVMVDSHHQRLSQSMPRIKINQDSTLTLKLGQGEGDLSTHRPIKTANRSKSSFQLKNIQQSPKVTKGTSCQNKVLLLQRSPKGRTTYEAASISCPTLQGSKLHSKSKDSEPKQPFKIKAQLGNFPNLKSLNPVVRKEYDPSALVTDMQEIIRKQRLLNSPLLGKQGADNQVFPLSVDTRTKVGPFFFKKR